MFHRNAPTSSPNITFHIAITLLILTVTAIRSEAEVYPYRYGNDQKIVTIKGLSIDLSRFDTVANGYIPHNGGNDFILMEQFDKNCGPNSVQMLLYYHRKHRRLKDIWQAADIDTVAFGTVPSELRQAFNELDVPAHWYSRRTLSDLRRYIDENRPPIMLLRLSNRGYHWVVAVGYDTRWDEFLIADPNGHFKWWTAEQLNANWSLEWLPEFEANEEEEWYEFQIDVGLINNIHLNPHTVIVPLEAPSFETNYLDYWSDMQAIEVYGDLEFRGGTREWEETLTFQNPFSIVQVSDIELLTSTGTARVDGWERLNNRSIRLWGTIEDGWVLRGRMWVIVRTFYFNDVAAADINVAKAPSALPIETSLLPNYPNPSNPETWIPYQLAKPADVSVSIYAADGKLVRTLALGHKPVGIYQRKSRAAYWDGKNGQGEPVASGIYFYTLKAGDFSATKKMLIRK